MKKYLFLILASFILLVLLVSCSTSQNGNGVIFSDSDAVQDSTSQSHTTIDSSTTNSSQTPNACEHIWVQNDADQCEHLEVCVLCGEKRGEDVLHIYFDENGIPLEKCLNCEKQNSQYIPAEKTNTVTFQFNYTYWHESETATGEYLATLLIDDSFLGRGFYEIAIPEDITAGDTITIEYTGYIEIAESFPGSIRLQDGEVKSYSFSYASIICVMGEQAKPENLKSEYNLKNDYVIFDREGHYFSLDEYEGDKIYLAFEQEYNTLPMKVVSMFAYNPRNTDNSEQNTISMEQAIEIAKNNFYSKYAKDYCFCEIEVLVFRNGPWVVCFEEFSNDGGVHEQIVYYYNIDNHTGEIISIEIAE